MASAEKSAIKESVIAFKKAKILEEAASLFYQVGYNETSVDVLAESLNVTKPFVYSYFPSKQHILYEICRPGVELSLKAAVEVSQSDESAVDKLKQLLKRFVIVVCEHQISIALYLRHQKSMLDEHHEKIVASRRAFDRILETILTEGKRSGDMNVRSVKIASLAFSGMVNWAHTWYRPDGTMPPAQIADRIVELALAALQVE
ncbi:MAG: TetR/AcrR family transcriptional regulator [Xanthobacteraceae bacterium]